MWPYRPCLTITFSSSREWNICKGRTSYKNTKYEIRVGYMRSTIRSWKLLCVLTVGEQYGVPSPLLTGSGYFSASPTVQRLAQQRVSDIYDDYTNLNVDPVRNSLPEDIWINTRYITTNRWNIVLVSDTKKHKETLGLDNLASNVQTKSIIFTCIRLSAKYCLFYYIQLIFVYAKICLSANVILFYVFILSKCITTLWNHVYTVQRPRAPPSNPLK